jgi:hypothetical protein
MLAMTWLQGMHAWMRAASAHQQFFVAGDGAVQLRDGRGVRRVHGLHLRLQLLQQGGL